MTRSGLDTVHIVLAKKRLSCRGWSALQYAFLKTWLTNGTFTRRDSILAETEFVNRATSDTDPYDQYEFSIKLEHVGDCMERVSQTWHKQAWDLEEPAPDLCNSLFASWDE